MNISSFDDLLRAAREEAEPQRLLFVFANAMLPDDSTPEQRLRFETGQGGALAPARVAAGAAGVDAGGGGRVAFRFTCA